MTATAKMTKLIIRQWVSWPSPTNSANRKTGTRTIRSPVSTLARFAIPTRGVTGSVEGCAGTESEYPLRKRILSSCERSAPAERARGPSRPYFGRVGDQGPHRHLRGKDSAGEE